MSKLRVSSHRLEIEVGRWSRPNRTPLDERKCFRCQKLEDEFHFLFECELHSDLRHRYLKRYFWNRPNILKLKELMSSSNKKIICNLAILFRRLLKLGQQHTVIDNSDVHLFLQNNLYARPNQCQ